jgi:transcriptional regulator with XRE-family HTH domain
LKTVEQREFMSIEQLIIERSKQVKQETIARALNKEASTVSKMLSSQTSLRIEELDALFEVLGLVVYEKETEVVHLTVDEWRALKVFSKKGLEVW